jgi:two-component system NtrC family sensor kinase
VSGPRRIPDSALEILDRLTQVSEELASAFRPATVVDVIAAVCTEVLAPDQMTIVLLDIESNRLDIKYDTARAPTRTDDPLLQLALRHAPLLLAGNVEREAKRLGAEIRGSAPACWIGAPVVSGGRTVGAVSLASERDGGFGAAELSFLKSVLAKAGIALANGRLVELLSAGKREWELTADSISQAICIIDAAGVVRRANRGFARLTQVPVTTLPGRPWLGLVPPAWADVVGRVLAHPGAPAVEMRAGDRILSVSAVAMAGADEGTTVLLFDDHTEKHRLQDQLIQSEKMSAMGQLIAGVAHDLNNPLASVVGFSDFLTESRDLPPHLAEPLQVIRQEAERAATIVRNLLSFARKQEGERTLQEIRPLLESTLALLKNQLMALKIEATLEVEPDLPAIVMNANQIKQVFVNLIVNAAQAIATGKRGGRVWVTAQPWLEGVAVSVSDDGPGISAELAPRVFEPFFTTKPEGEGTGLGLSICQGIVKEHGGSITLDTAPGQGATFRVELPAGRPPGAAAAAESPAPAHAHLRVLVVDDEPHILHYMRATLESWGHTVAVSGDGSDAVERARV